MDAIPAEDVVGTLVAAAYDVIVVAVADMVGDVAVAVGAEGWDPEVAEHVVVVAGSCGPSERLCLDPLSAFGPSRCARTGTYPRHNASHLRV